MMTIGGNTYSTDTAQKLCSIEGSGLYRTTRGLFFLCEAGQIMPLSYEEAQQWAKGHLEADDYIRIFGEPALDDTLTALNLTLSALAVSKFRLAAQRQQISQRELMERLIDTL